jgi:hypothetical protein
MPGLITYPDHRIVIGYHGCDRSLMESVLLLDEALQPSNNRYDWLGRGTYFWEHGPHRAWSFAGWKHSRGEIKTPAVLGAYIHLGRCFDLTDIQATSLLSAYHLTLEQLLRRTGQTLPHNRPAGPSDFDLVLRFRDCAVINYTLEAIDEHEASAGGIYYQTVRGVFIEGTPAFSGSAIHTHTHTQIAVRDPRCILGFFKPRPESYIQDTEASFLVGDEE